MSQIALYNSIASDMSVRKQFSENSRKTDGKWKIMKSETTLIEKTMGQDNSESSAFSDRFFWSRNATGRK